MGDNSFYTLSANGSLEQGNGGWLFNGGSKITSGDDPYALTAGKDHEVELRPLGTRTAPSTGNRVDLDAFVSVR